MSRAADIFKRLETGGVAAVEQLIKDAAAEELFLDFKGSRESGGAGALGEDDAKNMAKAISGFANSEGGVIVWGVDGRRKDGKETLEKAALKDANGFRKRIESAISRLTVPVHPRVRNVEILEDEGPSGYVATMVERSEIGPIRAIAKELDNYFVRVGDSFKTAPHGVLAGMFGKQPAGVVWLQFFGYPIGVQSGSGAISLAVGIGIANGGATLLERPYVAAQPGTETSRGKLRLVPTKATKVDLVESMMGNWQALSGPDTVIVPGGLRDICVVHFVIHPDEGALDENLVANMVVGVANAIPKRFTVECGRDATIAAIEAARQNVTGSTTELFGLEALLERVKAQ